MTSNFKYGLNIVNSKDNKKQKPTDSVFGDEDDKNDEMDANLKRSQSSLKEKKKPMIKIKDKLAIENALTQDPSIFEYDESEPEHSTSAKSGQSQNSKPKSRYISNMLGASEKRKLETERHLERKIQRERDAEIKSGKIVETEQFVTQAYRDKMEEFALLDKIDELQQKREDEEASNIKDLSAINKFCYDSRFRNKSAKNFANSSPEKILPTQELNENKSDHSKTDSEYDSEPVENENTKHDKKCYLVIEKQEDSEDVKMKKAKLSIQAKFGNGISEEDAKSAQLKYQQRKQSNAHNFIEEDSD